MIRHYTSNLLPHLTALVNILKANSFYIYKKNSFKQKLSSIKEFNVTRMPIANPLHFLIDPRITHSYNVNNPS